MFLDRAFKIETISFKAAAAFGKSMVIYIVLRDFPIEIHSEPWRNGSALVFGQKA